MMKYKNKLFVRKITYKRIVVHTHTHAHAHARMRFNQAKGPNQAEKGKPSVITDRKSWI